MKRDDRSTGRNASPEPADARDSGDARDPADPDEPASIHARERDDGERQYEDARRAKAREDSDEATDPDDEPEERTLMERLNEALQRNRLPRG